MDLVCTYSTCPFATQVRVITYTSILYPSSPGRCETNLSCSSIVHSRQSVLHTLVFVEAHVAQEDVPCSSLVDSSVKVCIHTLRVLWRHMLPKKTSRLKGARVMDRKPTSVVSRFTARPKGALVTLLAHFFFFYCIPYVYIYVVLVLLIHVYLWPSLRSPHRQSRLFSLPTTVSSLQSCCETRLAFLPSSTPRVDVRWLYTIRMHGYFRRTSHASELRFFGENVAQTVIQQSDNWKHIDR